MAIIKMKRRIISANAICARLLAHYRFKLGAIACTEYDCCDVFAIWPKKRRSVEIEVKRSIADLKNDFKKDHRIDLIDFETDEQSMIERLKKEKVISAVLPVDFYRPQIDQLYYAVPYKLVDDTVEILKDNCPFAGVISVGNYGVQFEKPAKKIKSKRKNINYDRLVVSVAKRMSSDLANKYNKWYQK